MIKLEEINNSIQTETIQTETITAIINTALCIGSGGSSGSLADKPIVRNPEGNLLIPASQLKGRLRHECEKIARGLKWDICYSPNPETMCPQRLGLVGNFTREEYKISADKKTENKKTEDNKTEDNKTEDNKTEDNKTEDNKNHHCLICQIFGNPVLPSRIIFDDLICEEEPENLPEIIRPGVTINRRRRTAEENKLYFLETSPANTKLRFTGTIHLLRDAPIYTKPLILAGFKHINALGGSKSAGLGWLNWELPNLTLEKEAWEFLDKGSAKNEKN